MSQPFLRLRRRSCCPHPDSTPCVPSAVNPRLSSLALGSPAWPGPPFTSTLGAQHSASGVRLPLAPCLSPPPRASLFLCLCLCLSLLISLCVCLSFSLSICLSHFLSLCLSSSLSVCPSAYVPLSVCLPLYLSLSLLTGCSSVFLVFYFRITKSHPTKCQTNEWTIQHKKWRGTGAFTPHPGEGGDPEQKLVNQDTEQWE